MADGEGRAPVTVHPTHAHWGSYQVLVRDGTVVGVRPDPADPAPSPVIRNTPVAQHHATRVARPAVRRRWLESGPGPDDRRGHPDDEYVAVDWETALDLLAAELDRVRREHGGTAVYGGSYGWASAGRLHHSQGQLHRFLNTIGGYTRSRATYSHAAVEVLFPHVVGPRGGYELLRRPPTWRAIAEHTDLLVSFGGLRVSNMWTASGGRAAHTAEPDLRAAAGRGVRMVSVSPLRDDTPADVAAEWLPISPGTDTAVLLALIHTLFADGLADTGFLARYTVGADELRDYVMGDVDGVPKSPEWAAELSGLPADGLRDLARRMAAGRTLVNVGWSVQRARYGEQPLWAGLALAACLGQIGLPGGGFATGYGSMGSYGGGATPEGLPTFPQGRNPVDSVIPVARVTDMLLNPGAPFDFDGRRLRYPDIRLVYWSGGNPFHHHQDLNRLSRAFGRPETVVVHETHWTATARHADIVLPSTTALERDDFTAGQGDLRLRAMPRVVAPHGEARDEYDVFSELAARMGVGAEFTEGRTSAEWLVHLYEEWRGRLRAAGTEVPPPFEEFWAAGSIPIPGRVEDSALFGDFRADPDGCPLGTPSGRIELYSATIAGFGYPDCPGRPTWLDPEERLGSPRSRTWPLLLVANQPTGRLHSQQDMGEHSRSEKIADRAPIRMHPADAAARGLADGDVVRVANDRGSCLAGVRTSTDLRPGVVQLATGAWFDPSGAPGLSCVHGNPNVLTPDAGTSALSHGSTGQLALVEVERFEGTPPPVRVFDPPRITPAAER
ncbi:molybdopterin-dependent oxidoreductase [Marinitenerispora sediminis]|uniref:Molybdopterin oxidoreductase n=1 Tax=Marinitenerispora sediminis TaxID=1931232 RepID=A0A368T994_9ACTN|nr:molybdopterin-dependent oxidoreductase [Marinitenerispora sediminis]RCV54762.1 molybdopterin oxidoreductase [Marinitenerispora sediminis]RCV60562.1 molybdopterin oxidoreductase [Marinitenerispora sediminis]RCV61028.1 molybdopterin oxidoreductase [Marinitenerispora sediminis]